jgi:carbon-monoxide dehydrogenase medium subunit
MYSREFDYVRAGSVQEAIQLLGSHEGAKLLAGGHSLIPILKLRQASPSVLVDIGRIENMRGISQQNGGVRIGSLTTHARMADSDDLPAVLLDAARNIADLQVRNRGTVGGNVAHADPASDLPTVFTALGATFHINGPGGERSVPAEDFFTGMFETALRSGEVLTSIEIPAPGSGIGSAYMKMVNPASGYALLGVAATVAVEAGRFKGANVALGGLTPKAARARSVEMALVGKPANKETIASAALEVAGDLGNDILGDLQAGEEYRRAMAPVYVRHALATAMQRAAG